MKIRLTGKNISITDPLRSAIDNKFSRFEKYFKSETEIHVILEVIKNRQIIEAMFSVNGTIFRAEESSNDMYVSLDGVVDKLTMQITRFKSKLEKKHKIHETIRFEDIPDYEEEVDDIKIVRTKRFDVKPMSPHEAVLQMELLSHAFFVFTNATTDEVNVVYKRKLGQYGLIEPTYE